MFIDPTIASDLVRHTGELLELIVKLPENTKPERKGVYLCVQDRVTGLVIFLVPIGLFDDLPFTRGCFRFCQEKDARLLSHPDHISSWQSRNRDLELYGGGIVCPIAEVLIAPSGLTEHGDEALAVGLGLRMRWQFNDHANQITEISQNPITPALRLAAGI